MEIALESCETQAVEEVGRRHVLTATQEAMVLRSLATPGAGHYIQQMVLPLPNPLREGDLRRAWEAVSRRHEVLRVSFEVHEGRPLAQRIARAIRCPLRMVTPIGADSGRELDQFLEEDRRRGFDLFEPPLWRFSVLRWASGDCTGVWTFHHALLAGRSRTKVLHAVMQYHADPDGFSPADVPPAVSFPSFLDWLAAQPRDHGQAYWSRRMAGFVSAPALPGLACRQDATMAEAGAHGLQQAALTATQTGALRDAAERHGVTVNNLVQGAWALALGCYNAVQDVTFGVTRAGRHWGGRASKDAVGMFMHTVPFRVDVRPDQPVGEWLRGLRSQQVEVRGHEFASAAEIRRWAGLSGGTPLWHSIIVFESRQKDEWEALGEASALHEKTDQLTLEACAGEELVLDLEFSPAVHAPEQIRVVLAHLRGLLLALSEATPDALLEGLSTMAAGGPGQVLGFGCSPRLPCLGKPLVRPLAAGLHSGEGEADGQSRTASARSSCSAPSGAALAIPGHWRGEEMPFPLELSVVDLFLEQARLRPEAIAVKDGDRLVSYGELERQARRVAAAVLRVGLSPEDPVAILLPRSAALASSLLGVLMAGGTYLPADPAVPLARLEYMLRDSGSQVVLTNASGVQHLRGKPVLAIDVEQLADERQASSVAGDPCRCAYIIYTSGSTGEPKGVEVEHHSLTNLVCHYKRQLALEPGHRAAMLANVAFDASVADVWPTLCTGGQLLVAPPNALQDPDALIAWLVREKATWVFVATGFAEILFERPWPTRVPLRFLLTGADRLTVRPPPSFPVPVINTYGPTENTVDSTWSDVAVRGGDSRYPPIGRPISNVNAYVLDEHRRPVEVGVEGELYLGGEQVARGYRGKPDLTAERFFADPFSDRLEARMYRSGDRARWMADGELEFLGRQDGQVQIRGNRVELGEIESVLLSLPSVRQACCVPRMMDGRATAVAAHVVPESGGAEQVPLWEAHLRARVAEYMVPTSFSLHDRLPLTSAGKIDRQSLQAVYADAAGESRQARPQSGLESALHRLWSTLLPSAATLPADATFRELGGDSLTAVRLQLGVEEITGRRIEVSSLLLPATFAGFCEAVEAGLAQMQFQPVLALRKSGSRPPLFCLYSLNGDVDGYLGLVEALGEDQPVYGVRCPGLSDETRMPESLESAAREAASLIRQVQPDGAPALVGHSWGGLLAFETSRQLVRMEGRAGFTGLVGTACPMEAVTRMGRYAHFLVSFPRWAMGLVADRENLMRRLSRWRTMAGDARRLLVDKTVHVPIPSWVSLALSKHLVHIAREYRPTPGVPLEMDYFRERDACPNGLPPPPHPLRPWDHDWQPAAGWGRWAESTPRVHYVDGGHVSVLKLPHAASLASAIRKAMDQRRTEES